MRYKLRLDVSKCNVLSFSRKRFTTAFPYNIGDETLTRSYRHRDLGVIFDNKLSFGEHIASTVYSAYATLGFLCRNCSDFTNTNDSLLILYNSLIRSKVKY